ncbi:MAG: hypothetical protein AAGE65_04365 [Planctomycetota bacterium]
MAPTPRDPVWLKRLAWGAVLGSAAALLFAGFLPYDTWERWVHAELGLKELLTVVYLLPACAVFAWLAWRGRKLTGLARGWFVLLAVGMLYFAGEEASWGQHVIGFEVPASIAANNLQGEFNLHNADAWYHDLLNEIPRTIAGLSCAVGAGVLPFFVVDKRKEAGASSSSWFWMIPTRTMVLPGWFGFGWNLPEKLLEDSFEDTRGWVDLALVSAADESKEYFIALAVLIYALSAWRRYRQFAAD